MKGDWRWIGETRHGGYVVGWKGGRLMERLISHNGWNADRAVRVRRHKEWRVGG